MTHFLRHQDDGLLQRGDISMGPLDDLRPPLQRAREAAGMIAVDPIFETILLTRQRYEELCAREGRLSASWEDQPCITAGFVDPSPPALPPLWRAIRQTWGKGYLPEGF